MTRIRFVRAGSRIFRASHARRDFAYDAARRHDGSTIACPEPLCVSGRVSFTVG